MGMVKKISYLLQLSTLESVQTLAMYLIDAFSDARFLLNMKTLRIITSYGNSFT